MNDQRAYFDDAAHRYPNAVNPPLAQQQELDQLERALGFIPGKHIADFGAGSGRVTFWFLKKGYNVTAIDISPQSLSDLIRTYKQYKQPFWGVLNTSTRLPKNQFDAIIGADILHHVHMREYLPKLFRILKPGGCISFSEPNAWFFPWYVYIFLHRLPWSIERGILQMTTASLMRALKETGFGNIRITGFPRFLWFRLIVSAQKTELRHRLGKPSHP